MAEMLDDDVLWEALEALHLDSELYEKVRIDQPLSADSDRVVRAFPLLLPMPNLAGMPQMHGKNAALADEWRTQGNQELGQCKEVALAKYSRSIALAPAGSQQLALGFLNRSKALFGLHRYDAAMRDLGRASSGGLPSENQYKLEEQRARCLHAIGCKEAAQLAKKEALRLLNLADSAVPADKAEASRNRLMMMTRKRRKAPVYDTTKPLPVPVGGANPKVAGLSRWVDIRYTLQRGRHLMANRDINPGDILLVEEPLAPMLYEHYYNTHCFHCMKRCLDMVPCPLCSQVMFCSEKCRDDAWVLYHNIECRLLPHMACLNENNEPSTLLKLSLRLTLSTLTKHGGLQAVYKKQKLLEEEPRKGPEAKRIFDSCGRYDPASLRAVYYLPRVYLGSPGATTLETLPIHAARILCAIKELTHLLNPDSDTELAKFLGGFILRMVSIRMNSNFGLGEFDGTSRYQIGNAVYAVSSLINHSCNPNAFPTTANGGYSVLVATQPIAKGEEITVSYASTFAQEPRRVRRMQLVSYQFECMCEACKNNWPTWNEPIHSRTDYTLKCDACGGRFQGPYHRTSVKCSHCSHRVETPILDLYKRICNESAKKEVDQKVILGAVVDVHKVMAFPNDLLYVINETMRHSFTRLGNLNTDSW